jgi:hypothetical protein
MLVLTYIIFKDLKETGGGRGFFHLKILDSPIDPGCSGKINLDRLAKLFAIQFVQFYNIDPYL